MCLPKTSEARYVFYVVLKRGTIQFESGAHDIQNLLYAKSPQGPHSLHPFVRQTAITPNARCFLLYFIILLFA
jgi:hypothetical protein